MTSRSQELVKVAEIDPIHSKNRHRQSNITIDRLVEDTDVKIDN